MVSSQDPSNYVGRDLWAVLDEWEAEPVSITFNRRLFERIQAVDQGWSLRRLLAFLSGVIVLASAIGLTTGSGQPPGTANFAAAPESTMETQVAADAGCLSQALEDLKMFQVLDSARHFR